MDCVASLEHPRMSGSVPMLGKSAFSFVSSYVQAMSLQMGSMVIMHCVAADLPHPVHAFTLRLQMDNINQQQAPQMASLHECEVHDTILEKTANFCCHVVEVSCLKHCHIVLP